MEQYREVLREQGIDLADDELRALQDHLRGFARLMVDLYLKERTTTPEQLD